MSHAFDPTRRAQLAVAPASLHALHAALAAAVGPAAAAGLLQEAGYATGLAHAAALADWLAARGEGAPQSLSLGDFQARLEQFFRELGWGELRLHVDGAVSIVETRQWAEWQPRDTGGPSGCHFTTGMLAGLFGALASHPVAVLEVPPEEDAAGATRFAFGAEGVMSELFSRLQRGDDVETALGAMGGR